MIKKHAFVQQTLCFEGYFEAWHKELLLHSNSQLANSLSVPAKNASWGSTPIVFTVYLAERIKAVESPLYTGACPWSRQCHISEHSIWCQAFPKQPCGYLKVSYISNSPQRVGEIAMQKSRKMCIPSLLSIDSCKESINFPFPDKAYSSVWLIKAEGNRGSRLSKYNKEKDKQWITEHKKPRKILALSHLKST